nr:aspartic proteinase-like protein 2 isoform X1 [Tanacetum cinerariifolium]
MGSDAWLYYAKIGIGTPPKDYYVQVDTGSDIMWINCVHCQTCLEKGYHGLDLTRYNPNESLTSARVTCDQKFCLDINQGTVGGCRPNVSCMFVENYEDGSGSIGYFIKDVVQYDSVSGDLETKLANGSVIFGCGASQSGNLRNSEDALDGIIGFGKSNASVISQLASYGKVKKMFAHCLDVAKSQAGLTSGFYSSICHKAEATVRFAVETHFKDDHTVAATLLRLHFHDCFVESICLEGSCREDVVHRLLSLMIKHYVGEDPEPLSLRELQNVEQQLETALKQILIRKDGMLKNKSTYEIMSPEDIGLTLGKLRYANYIMQELYVVSGYFKEEAESKYSKILGKGVNTKLEKRCNCKYVIKRRPERVLEDLGYI